ncbi:antitermination regulator [Hydrogenophaga crassostreae]|uniref:Antitermination regulator n=1 Tax=Hydrogenophaga crassostreae TaxID=1763535 RepID=A0A167IVH7_9BURK|nr:nitrate regulatory protein [Hydrogenophaga crassostreae]AOW14327.1 antitermination regulator [Hydrogenophaga crassostreae]OAD43651.1 antitermination regulator [Hydrogenophaga crassostreae]
MTSGLRFLIAAKRCEITELQQLAHTSALVNAVGRLVHGLQRERGLTNLHLASQNAQWEAALGQQILDSETLQAQVASCFEGMNVATARPSQGARLFSRIAYALQGMAALPALRRRLRAEAWPAERATAAYVRLISSLLAVVFEAADTAADPGISRSLVALFNFMQGKELTGQERATGSALFAAGQANAVAQQRLLHLIESQERCLQVFEEFASPPQWQAWQLAQHAKQLATLERMRRVLCTASNGAPLDRQLSQVWFDANTAVIDAMKAIEDRLALDLLELCETRLAAATAELATFEALNSQGNTSRFDPADDLSFFDQASPDLSTPASALSPTAPGFGLQLDRSILELVQDQARRLQSMAQELDTVRASLSERKLIERAKGLLMAHRRLSEEDAHKNMRQMAMNQNRRLIDVAEALLSMAEVLPEPQR